MAWLVAVAAVVAAVALGAVLVGGRRQIERGRFGPVTCPYVLATGACRR